MRNSNTLRWCHVGGLSSVPRSKKQHPNDSGATLRPRTTRVIEDSLAAADHLDIFIVPGGQHVVSSPHDGIFICDLGYTSSADCKLIASVAPEDGLEDRSYRFCMVQATRDGMGYFYKVTAIKTGNNPPMSRKNISLGYPAPIASTAGIFRPQSHSYTITLRDCISGLQYSKLSSDPIFDTSLSTHHKHRTRPSRYRRR